jgi:integrase
MASASRDKNGNGIIQFIGADKKRRSIRAGNISEARLELFRERVELLRACQRNGQALDGDTADWLAKMPDDLHAKLTAVNLVSPRASANLDAFMASYIAGRTDIGGRSHSNLKIAAKHVNAFFGERRSLQSITPAHADAFAIWVKGKFAEATAARIVKRARQFFSAAIRARLIVVNPFEGIKPGSMANADRKFHVSREIVAKVLDECPDHDWRVMVALSRFGGLRCPSEVLELKWADVNWEKARLLIRSTKTGNRFVPIFPELLPFLEASWDAAEEGAVYVVARYRGAETNLRTTFLKIIDRAGVKQWVKPFHNMRASRETELAAEFPIHVVCAWIGNSQAVATKHYLTVREEDFEKASQSAAKSGAITRLPCCTEKQEDAMSPQKHEKMALCATREMPVDLGNTTYYPRQDSNLRPSV